MNFTTGSCRTPGTDLHVLATAWSARKKWVAPAATSP